MFLYGLTRHVFPLQNLSSVLNRVCERGVQVVLVADVQVTADAARLDVEYVHSSHVWGKTHGIAPHLQTPFHLHDDDAPGQQSREGTAGTAGGAAGGYLGLHDTNKTRNGIEEGKGRNGIEEWHALSAAPVSGPGSWLAAAGAGAVPLAAASAGGVRVVAPCSATLAPCPATATAIAQEIANAQEQQQQQHQQTSLKDMPFHTHSSRLNVPKEDSVLNPDDGTHLGSMHLFSSRGGGGGKTSPVLANRNALAPAAIIPATCPTATPAVAADCLQARDLVSLPHGVLQQVDGVVQHLVMEAPHTHAPGECGVRHRLALAREGQVGGGRMFAHESGASMFADDCRQGEGITCSQAMPMTNSMRDMCWRSGLSHGATLMTMVRLVIVISSTHCNTLQHTATQCNTLQHTATHCNTL